MESAHTLQASQTAEVLLSNHAFVGTVIAFGTDAEKRRWRLVAKTWHLIVSETPDYFTHLTFNSMMKNTIQVVLFSGKRLVHLECANATDELLTACAGASPFLQHLLVAPSPSLTMVPAVWDLRTLDVRGCFRVLKALPTVCTSLRELKLGWWKEADPDGRQTEHGLLEWGSEAFDIVGAIASKAKKLQALHIRGHWPPGDFKALANLTELEVLHIPYAITIDNQTVRCLSNLPSLKALNLRACRVDAPTLRNLVELNMSCSFLTCESLISLAGQCPNLQCLDLCYAPRLNRTVLRRLAEFALPLKMFGLGGFELRDEDLAFIINTWGDLENLGIGGAKVSNEGLAALTRLCKLKFLSAHKLTLIEEDTVWKLLQQLEEVDLEDCTYKTPPSGDLLKA